MMILMEIDAVKKKKSVSADKPNDDMFNNNLMKKVLIQNIDVDLYIHRARKKRRSRMMHRVKEKKNRTLTAKK